MTIINNTIFFEANINGWTIPYQITISKSSLIQGVGK